MTAHTQLWVYNSENCFVGLFYQFTCRVKRTKGLNDKPEFWDRLFCILTCQHYFVFASRMWSSLIPQEDWLCHDGALPDHRMLGNSCVSRISRDSITGYNMPSKLGLVLIGARFLLDPFRGEILFVRLFVHNHLKASNLGSLYHHVHVHEKRFAHILIHLSTKGNRMVSFEKNYPS